MDRFFLAKKKTFNSRASKHIIEKLNHVVCNGDVLLLGPVSDYFLFAASTLHFKE